MDSEAVAGVGFLVIIALFLAGLIFTAVLVLIPLLIWGIFSRLGQQNRDMARALRVLGEIKTQLEKTGIAKSGPKISGKVKPASARTTSLPPIKRPEAVEELDDGGSDEIDELDEIDGQDEIEENDVDGFECGSCSYKGTEEEFTTSDGLACPNCGQN